VQLCERSGLLGSLLRCRGVTAVGANTISIDNTTGPDQAVGSLLADLILLSRRRRPRASSHMDNRVDRHKTYDH